MRAVKAIPGAVVILFGAFGAMLSLVALADPSGTQMADDLDPFGKPPPLIWTMAVLVMFVAVIGLGAWLVHGSSRRKYAST